MVGASLAAINVEIAIGTCRQHLPMVRVEASSFTDQAASTRSAGLSAIVGLFWSAAIGHMPMVRAEVSAGGLTGASARSKIPILPVWLRHCAELF